VGTLRASHERRVAEREGFEPPCRLPGKTLSRRPRYDHFGKMAARKRMSRAGLQVFLKPNRHLFGSKLNAYINDPRLPRGGGRILPGIVGCQPRRNVTSRSDVSMLRIVHTSENVDEALWLRAHLGDTCKRRTSRDPPELSGKLEGPCEEAQKVIKRAEI
jgi:hypothetical protein